jgi:two-component system phosphate regulon sensor histidine kinase PhoR
MLDPIPLKAERWRLAALLALPAAAVLALLAAFSLLAWPFALAGAVAVVAASAWIARRLLAELDRVRRTLATVGDSERGDGRPPPPRWPPAARLTEAAAEAGRRVEAERARLARRADAAAAALVALPDAWLLIDEAGAVRAQNRAARDLLGDLPIGSDIGGALRDPAFERALAAFRAAAAAGDAAARAEAEIALPGAASRWLRVAVRRLPPGAPEGAAAIVVLHDQTALRRLDRMRADFVANVSHELKTPLASLLGFIETLRGPAADDADARRRFLEIMHEQAQRMARLVDDIMSLSRIEMEEDTPPVGRVALLPLAQDLVEALQVQAGRRRMSFAIDAVPPDRPDGFAVIGDRDQLVQVLQNLLDNAIKYGREGATLRIELAAGDAQRLPPPRDALRPAAAGAVELAVVDQGEGIPPEHLDRLTERFFRVDRGRARQVGSTGLGLAIVKHIVHRHGGRLAVSSRLGHGSRFAVLLPAAEAPPPGPRALAAG